MLSWLRDCVLERGMINEVDLDLLVMVDTAEEAVAHVVEKGAELRAREDAAARGNAAEQQEAARETAGETSP